MHTCTSFCVQLWTHAYRDEVYHAAVDTNNGVESQNKMLKYNFLPRNTRLTLSRLVVVLNETFLPDMHHKHMFLNYQMLPTYRAYNSFVPLYLHGRPRQVIIHCLERKSNCQKYNEEDITVQDAANGVFKVTGSGGKLYTVDFGKTTNKPSCSCLDWIKWQIPCKHFFAIFRLVPEWSWDALPRDYRNNPSISIHTHDQATDPLLAAQHESSSQLDNEIITDTLDLPNKQVGQIHVHVQTDGILLIINLHVTT